MKLLTLNFLLYTFGGIWRPVEWSSNFAKLLYNAFTCVALFLIYFLLITLFLHLVFVPENVDNFTSNALVFATSFILCSKATVIVLRRTEIINLLQILLEEPCKPRNEDETVIQRKYDEFIRLWTIRYSLLISSSLTSFLLKAVVTIRQRHFLFNIWIPYDSNAALLYWFICIQQLLGLIFGSFVNMATETMAFGLFLQTCAQLEIFEDRLRKFVANRAERVKRMEELSISSNKEGATISEHIRHHLTIYKYAKTVNDVLNEMLFIQFFGSILVLCTTVYHVSTHVTESETATYIMYSVSIFVQIYMFCWAGNEVILKSMQVGDVIYHMDWPMLSASENKDLMIIMRRCTIPIKFTSSFLITLSLESYTSILKTSYSAFNVLQQS